MRSRPERSRVAPPCRYGDEGRVWPGEPGRESEGPRIRRDGRRARGQGGETLPAEGDVCATALGTGTLTTEVACFVRRARPTNTIAARTTAAGPRRPRRAEPVNSTCCDAPSSAGSGLPGCTPRQPSRVCAASPEASRPPTVAHVPCQEVRHETMPRSSSARSRRHLGLGCEGGHGQREWCGGRRIGNDSHHR